MKKKLNINKTVFSIIILNVVHLSVLAGVLTYSTFSNNLSNIFSGFNTAYLFFYTLIFVTLFINSFITIRNAIALSHTDTQYEILKDTLSQLENLNKTLRAQRHDFMNHLQVVYSLMEMQEYNDAEYYIEQVYNDIQKVNRALRTANPAINALLQAKALDCEKRNIQTIINVTSRLEGFSVPSWEMCRVLGNIIDNSMSALEELKDNRTIEINIFEDLKAFGFSIKNNGPSIPKNITEKIFDPGFTTKGTKGEGMGLFISKNIVEKSNGVISVTSSDETTFEIRFPKENDNSSEVTV